MANFFPAYQMKPNPQCLNKHCRELSSQRKDEPLPGLNRATQPAATGPVHETNEFEIELELCGDDTGESEALPTQTAEPTASVDELTQLLKAL
jgi:hypothetical protein